jgi:hypothetical protein
LKEPVRWSDESTEFFVRLVGISCREEVSNIVGDLFLYFDFGRVVHRVLSQVELAALPGDSGEGCLSGDIESFVSVADDQLDSVQAALLARRWKSPGARWLAGHHHAEGGGDYDFIYWNPTWSPNSSKLCFKARVAKGH